MKLNTYQKVALIFYVILVIYWIFIFLSGFKSSGHNYAFSFLFGLIPLIGGVIAIFNAKNWGGIKSSMGKVVLFIGLGVFLWGYGEMIWSFYNIFLHTPAPYPSLADLGFAPSIFFYGLGAAYLSMASGAKFGLRNTSAKVFVTLAPIIILIFSYYILVIVARGGVLLPPGESPVKAVLDIAYPLGDFLSLTIAVIISGLSFKYLGGRFKIDIYAILLGLAVMFIGDSSFSYTTTVGTYYNANWGDLLLMSGTFLLTFGVLGFTRSKNEVVKAE